jgi:hypothetical protein
VENLADTRLLEEPAVNMRGEQMLIGFTFGAREKKQHLVVRVFSDASGEANAILPEIKSKKCNSHSHRLYPRFSNHRFVPRLMDSRSCFDSDPSFTQP